MAEYKIARRRNKNFATINNVPLKDRNLSLRAKGFLIMIMGLPDTWDFSIKGISMCIKESEGIVRLIVTELKEAGYCKCIRECNKGKVVKWRYIFTDERGKFDDEETSSDDDQLNDLPLVEKTTCGKSQSGINKENIYNNKENNKEKTLLTESEKGADAPTHNDNDIDDKKLRKRLSHKYNDDEPVSDIEVKFYLGMEKKYPRIMRMDVPLKYSQYQQLLKDGVSNKKIIANLEAMENWKPLNSKRVIAYQTLLNFIKGDRNEYPQEMA